MRRRKLGESGLEVPVVILGAWSYGGWFWGKADDQQAIRTIHRALDLGMSAIDTAPVYGLGHSEEVVGRAIADRRGEAQILTKCGLRWDDGRGEFDFTLVMADGDKNPIYRNLRPDSVRHECEQSLLRLGVETLDLYQCHWPDPTTPIAETMGEMVRLYREGKIRAVGVSNFSPAMMEEARAALDDVPLAADQPKYNPLSRGIEEDVIPYLLSRKIGLLAYSPLDLGLLTGKIAPTRKFGPGDLRAALIKFTPENRRRVNEAVEQNLGPIAREHEATPAQVVIAWVVARPGVTGAIVGARSPEQAEENARAGDLQLTPEEMDRITRSFEEVKLEKPDPPE